MKSWWRYETPNKIAETPYEGDPLDVIHIWSHNCSKFLGRVGHSPEWVRECPNCGILRPEVAKDA